MEIERKIVLAIGAHPDDIDFTAAGTVAKCIQGGAKAFYLVATDGGKGSDDPKMTSEKLVAIREEEQKNAAKILGVSEVFFLRYPDTELEVTRELKEQIVRYIRMLKPDTVITVSPQLYFQSEVEAGYVNHTDHRAIAEAVLDSVFPLARDRLTYPEHEKAGLQPHKTKELLMQNLDAPKYVVDISATIDKKIEALRAHASQFTDFEGSKERLKKRAGYYGKTIHTDYGENFTRILFS